MQRVLVANRGEIARRVFATCRRLGLGTVAVYTDPDADAPHVAEADARVRLDGVSGYLDARQLVAAALAAGADAVHPGYGFLSENPDFAAAVIDAGLTWIGPPVAAVRAMGSKIEAKKLMAAAGVPVLAELDPATVTAEQLPVLVKASAGGGGRGMRVVHDVAALSDEVAAAQREAASAFGDPTVFCERYLATGHHIEVQIMADAHGTVWAVGERECSIQRRHQKVIEEAPSPLVERTPGMRERLFEAARLAAEAIGYAGAGTVEFLAGTHGDFFFLEMNTRLQVEHPVTEETTGLDLVELQLQVADGERLPAEPPVTHGHSIEARLYAEDPAAHWQPQAGRLHRVEFPAAATAFTVLGRPGVRVDSGVRDGSVVSVHYDPMLAKVISYGASRGQAAALLADALQRARIHGVRTNRDLLVNVLRLPAFRDGDTDTAFFDTHGLHVLAAPLADARAVRWSAVAAALAEAARRRRDAAVLPSAPSGWRNLASGYQVATYADGAGDEHRVAYRYDRDALRLPDDPGVALVTARPDEVVLRIDGVDRPFAVARVSPSPVASLAPGSTSPVASLASGSPSPAASPAPEGEVFVDSPLGAVTLAAVPRFPDPGAALAHGSLVAPMPGSVVRVAVSAGDAVTAGQPLFWLEAMKMEHTISAPADGVLAELNVAAGQQVEVGTVLARIDSAAAAEGEPQ
ncbi:biotin/lipoyl-binding protein [Mycobacterium sp. MYCO198283]|uniref:acetyl/propionyl/methylcrotonyl-CoA carboxylase subunit alpha n=1 Tax=Mycobacterium sp. MYCO198283 TaxID=2883505 RepID=UPI001E4C1E32|nr:biotin carboxylase N-terminal domain-containing protein [Mycobacterium sp. MYCO198283]MCG5430995.1 biotin/lipoyl-binding protein [Mycobacterium sp. MYCO198283]